MVGGATGLIPSQFLEEKRKSFVPRDFDGSGEDQDQVLARFVTIPAAHVNTNVPVSL